MGKRKPKCSEQDYWRLVRLRDSLAALKSLAANLEWHTLYDPTARWLPDELKALYLKMASSALKRARQLEREVKSARAEAQRSIVGTGAWKTDEGRLIATGLTEAASAIKEKKPLESVAKIAEKLVGPQAAPKEIMPGAKSRLEEILPPEYVG